jgi:L-fuconolactonase
MHNFWIDAHHHLWRYIPEEYPWMSDRLDILRRDFSADDLQALCREHRVEGTVAVQARQTLTETDWLLDIAERNELIRGVVGWVPLTEADVEQHLNRLSQRSLLKGVRHILHDEPDPNYMLRPDFNAGIGLLERYGLSYDLLIFAEQLPQTIAFVDSHPNQVFILDHIAKPHIASGEIETWAKHIHALSERQNVYCKLSGMVTEAEWSTWTEAQLRPYFEAVLSAFGPSRLMFGSDWPVLTLASSYGRWIETVTRMLRQLSDEEADNIIRRTAEHVYGLTPSRRSSFEENTDSTDDESVPPL